MGSVHEGFPYAEAISRKGYNAFVLKYRAGQGGTVATEDLAAAVSYIIRNSAELGVGAGGYSLWGSSAERGWQPRSVRTEWRDMEAVTYLGRRPS